MIYLWLKLVKMYFLTTLKENISFIILGFDPSNIFAASQIILFASLEVILKQTWKNREVNNYKNTNTKIIASRAFFWAPKLTLS